MRRVPYPGISARIIGPFLLVIILIAGIGVFTVTRLVAGSVQERFSNQLGENERYEGNISCKDGHNKGQKWYGPNRRRRYSKEVARIHRRTRSEEHTSELQSPKDLV